MEFLCHVIAYTCMYGKSVLSMSMTHQKPKDGRGYSLQWPIRGG